MANQSTNAKSLTWVYITAAGFILFLAIAIAFSLYSDKLNVISTSTYFFLLVFIGLIAAGFLFGALKSNATYQGKAYNGTLQLSGPVVVLAIIIFLGYKFRPSDNSFTSTVNLFSSDSSHTPVTNGQLTVYYGSAHVSKTINEGQVVLSELPKTFRGKEVTLIPNVEGYSNKSQKVILPVNENVLNLYLDRILDSIIVTGIVLSSKGKAVKNVTVVFADGIAKATTDAYGNFKAVLPFKDGSESTIRIYDNEVLKYNNLVRLTNQVPLSLQLN